MAVRAGSVRSCLGDDVRGRTDQSVRMEQSASLSRWLRGRGKSILTGQQLLVHHRYPDAAGQRFKPEGTQSSCSKRLHLWHNKDSNYLIYKFVQLSPVR